ncbi:MAG: VWA domain-containing protein [Armatimonadetes bacterium]|nr:VWA domain-containing protein [Armatimonadota bacterium]
MGRAAAAMSLIGTVLAPSPAAAVSEELLPGLPAIMPEVQPDTEDYANLPENEFLAVDRYPLSTFSVDVDTASYSNVRRFLTEGKMPPPDAVRVEEMVNYFVYDYPRPAGQAPFSITTEVAACPWNTEHQLMRIGIQGRPLEGSPPPRNLVFLLDVSGSMSDSNKLPLLKKAMRTLVETLTQKDKVAIVVYAGASGLVLPSTIGSEKQRILQALDGLEAGGSTNGGSGIELAYRVAGENYLGAGINRVILATDGDFNLGTTSQGELMRLIGEKRKTGVFLTVLGLGTGNLKDSTMEMLADRGNGNYAYFDKLAEARKVLVAEGGATLVTIAKDVKIQVEFNPRHVSAYRLIGYENRVLKEEDFKDDSKDAGEIGAGHRVTALYELVRPGQPDLAAGSEPLRYQSGRATTALSDKPELLIVKVRYKPPDQGKSRELEHVVARTQEGEPSGDFRFAAAVAGFGMLLRNSRFKAQANYRLVAELAQGALARDDEGYRREFLELVKKAQRLA